ncbi:YceH family protein [Psychromonas sp.]|uniref:YceH family protein n=1 Tax=Psychromonas sp. TaxID=1884585 RepID=UPI0035689C34
MIRLTALQSRVIGVMLEKEITTPEQYPLSLNALTNGCNQKSNREPVMSLSEAQVQNVVDELMDMKQLMVDSGASGRVNKYKHRFCNTSFGSLQLTKQQKAIICVLFLRGPQTPGELRTRTNRLADFANVNEVEAALEQLQHVNNTQLVKKLAREAGKRESRYIHLFSDTSEEEFASTEAEVNSAPVSSADQGELETRVALLEQEVNALKTELARLSVLLE